MPGERVRAASNIRVAGARPAERHSRGFGVAIYKTHSTVLEIYLDLRQQQHRAFECAKRARNVHVVTKTHK